MNVSLTPELEAYVQSRVKSGQYTSASEVVREALRLHQTQDPFASFDPQEIRELVQEGIDEADAGQIHNWEPDQLRMRVRERAMKYRKNPPAE